MVDAPTSGRDSLQTVGLLSAATLGLGAWVLFEARIREPLVALSVFRRRRTVIALVLMIAGMGTVLAFHTASRRDPRPESGAPGRQAAPL